MDNLPATISSSHSMEKIQRADLSFRKKEKKRNAIKQMDCGFDVIWNRFFVLESYKPNPLNKEIEAQEIVLFDSFDDYYEYLDGNIYENSCYYQFDFSNESIKKYELKVGWLHSDHLTDLKIERLPLDKIRRELESRYRKIERDKLDVLRILDESVCNGEPPNSEVMVQYGVRWSMKSMRLFYQENPNAALEYCKRRNFISVPDALDLSISCGKDLVLDLLPRMAKEKHIARLKAEIEHLHSILDSNDYSIERKGRFDEATHLFEVSLNYYDGNGVLFYSPVRICRTLDGFVHDLDYDLSGVDLSKYIGKRFDFSSCTTDADTRLPPDKDNLTVSLSKKYDPDHSLDAIDADARVYTKCRGSFNVDISWQDESGTSPFNASFKFIHFFDFAYFLGGDIKGADLLLCDGLGNLNNDPDLDLRGIHCRSQIKDKLGIPYEKFNYGTEIRSFDPVIINEDSTRELLESSDIHRDESDENEYMIHYISDIHLMHKFMNCSTEDDVGYEIKKIADSINREQSEIMLIAGDTSSDFGYYLRFINLFVNSALPCNYFSEPRSARFFLIRCKNSVPDRWFSVIFENGGDSCRWDIGRIGDVSAEIYLKF